MDKKFLKEHNLMETYKQFMRLCEWSYVPSLLPEDEEDDNTQPQDDQDMGGDMPPMDGGMPQGGGQGGNQDMGSMPPMDGNMAQGNEQMPPMGGDQMGGDPNAQGGQGEMPPMDDASMGGDPMGGDMPPMDGAPMGEEDEVIDVEELTDAQETMNDKVNTVGRNLGDVDDKITELLGSLSKMQAMIDNNNQEIAEFKKEFEKRNPTQTEKLNLRSLDSYPFNVRPEDYWREKGEEYGSNYSAYADNDKSTTQEYEITNSDVDDFDEREIEHSFDADLDDLHQDIAKIFGL